MASRVARTANTVNSRATNVHSHALPFSSLVAVSSMFKCSCVGSSAANSSYDGRKAAVTWFWIFTVNAGRARLAQQRARGTRPSAACSDDSRPSAWP